METNQIRDGRLVPLNTNHILELYLNDAVCGIEHILREMGQLQDWEALVTRHSVPAPLEFNDLARVAAPPGSDQSRVHLLGWIAFRACYPDIRAVLARFKLENLLPIIQKTQIQTIEGIQALSPAQLQPMCADAIIT